MQMSLRTPHTYQPAFTLNYTDVYHDACSMIPRYVTHFANTCESQVQADITAATHTISQVTGLQTALDSKVDSTRILTDVPVGMPFNSLVADLSKVTDMVDGLSGISLGTGTGASQRVACYEVPSSSHYFFGVGLVEQVGSLPGLGIWASTGTNIPHQNSSSSSGIDPHFFGKQ